MKRAEMTLQTIVIAVLVLTVLAVLLFMFYNSSKVFSKGTNSCLDTGGQCISKAQCVLPNYIPRSGTCDGSDSNTICCQRAPNFEPEPATQQ